MSRVGRFGNIRRQTSVDPTSFFQPKGFNGIQYAFNVKSLKKGLLICHTLSDEVCY